MIANAFIAGAPRSGTSSLHAWLSAHPDVYGAPDKETCFFVDPGTHVYNPRRNVGNGLDGYAACFPGARAAHRVVLDSTPSYLYARTALAHIPALPMRPRVLFVLREPAAQIHSSYRYFRDNWTWIPREVTFARFLELARSGEARFGGNELAEKALLHADYAPFLRAWRDALGPDRLHVDTFERLVGDRASAMDDVCAFLGLDAGFYRAYDFSPSNEAYAPRHAALQALSVRLRGRLADGPLRRSLRAVYRAVNTTRASRPDAEERRLVAALRREFAPANAALAEEFRLDLSPWALER